MAEYSSYGKILYNEVKNTGADGIYSTEGTNNVEIAYNKLYHTGDDAISVTSYSGGTEETQLVHDIDIHNNSISGNNTCRNITVNGCKNINIYNNYIEDGSCGVSVGATTSWGSRQNNNIRVYSNIIKNTMDIGKGTIGGGALHLYNNQSGTDTDIEFYNNDIYSSDVYGIYVWGTNNIQAKLYNNSFYLKANKSLYKNDNANATGVVLENNNTYSLDDYDGDDFFDKAGISEDYVKEKNLPGDENKKIYNLGRQNIEENEDNKLGVWSFFATAGYYPVKTITSAGYPSAEGNLRGSGIRYDKYKYGKLSDEKYYIPVNPAWYSRGDLKGLYFGYDGGYQRSHIFIPTLNKDGTVKFDLNSPENTYYKMAGDMAVCFTAPRDGYYDLNLYAENRGKGLEDGTGDGFVRVTVLKGTEVFENAQNTEDVYFGKFKGGVAEPPSIKKSEQLSKGDRIYVRLSAGYDGYNDEFYAKLKIAELNEEGEQIASYDLSDAILSSAGQFEFYNAPQAESNTDNYIKIYAASGGAMSGRAMSPIYTISNYKNMYSLPCVTWDAKENTDKVAFKNSSNDMIVAWKSPENGRYTLKLNAVKGMIDRIGGNLIISKVKKGENAGTVIGTLTVPDNGEEKSLSLKEWLEEGDRLYIRANNSVQNSRLGIDSDIIIEKSDILNVDYYKNGQKISQRSEFTPGSEIEARVKLNNYDSGYIMAYAIIALYSDTGKFLSMCSTEKMIVMGNGSKETKLKFTVPENEENIRIKAFAWDNLNSLKPLDEALSAE